MTPKITRSLAVGFFFLLIPAAFSGEPAWWTSQTSPVLDTSKTASDYALLNQGQLANMAHAAYTEMETVWAAEGGAGDDLDALMTSLNQLTSAYSLANIGQVKSISAKFYDRFTALGLAVRYPWSNAANPSRDYGPANIGQLKWLFSFEIQPLGVAPDRDGDGLDDLLENYWFGNVFRYGGDEDADADGLPSWFEMAYNLSDADDGQTNPDFGPNGDPDQDGLTNIQEWEAGTNPVVADADGDGIPDSWELTYFGNLTRDGTGNFDGDILSDLQEFRRGTDPVDAASFLNIVLYVDTTGSNTYDGWSPAYDGLHAPKANVYAAAEAAASGDTIEVAAGTYFETQLAGTADVIIHPNGSVVIDSN